MMIAKLSPELVRELEQVGDQPLPVENPLTKRVYVLVDTQEFDVVRRGPGSVPLSGSWTESKNERRCALIRKKFSQGIDSMEAGELNKLQDELSNFRKQAGPLPYDVIDTLQAALNSPATTTT